MTKVTFTCAATLIVQMNGGGGRRTARGETNLVNCTDIIVNSLSQYE